jgi:glucosamine--fructose-6-phosphate aminotransferase (isomerizing)
MCGIVGAIGDLDLRKYLIEGLYSLDYRGYDSAGVTFLNDNNDFSTFKAVGKVTELDKKVPLEVFHNIGIGHTRWATHGAPTEENCHPHFSSHNEIALVHNGVIENYRALKTRLIEYGYTFYSETDTEVIANLLEYNYRKNNDMLDGIRRTIEELEGSFALAIINIKEKDKLYFAKRSSPLFIGLGKDKNFLASDAVPMIKYTNEFIDLTDDTYGYITKDEHNIFSKYQRIDIPVSTQNPDFINRDLGDNPNYMIKEIQETPDIINRLIDNYFDGQKFLFSKPMLEAIRKSDDIVFIACGTSYHASLMGVRYMRYLGKRSEAYVASEWAYYPVFTAKKPLYILISQSGETADLIRCQKIINSRGSINIAITNTKSSTIERNATFSCLLFAGLEVAVASTKAFSAQVALLALLTGAIEKRNNAVQHLRVLVNGMRKIIERKKEIEDIASRIENSSMVFFIGRGNDYVASLEASLKMKEISYLHCEAFPAGELKHGPIALVDDNTSVVAFNSDMSTNLALRNNVKEVEARGAKTFIISYDSLNRTDDAFSVEAVKSYLSTIPMVFFAQYLAYYVTLHKGLNIDKPRNLAKSVTVE